MDRSARRWPAWIPWSIAGTGAVIAAAGGVLYWRASQDYRDFNEKFVEVCGEIGCEVGEHPELDAQLRRAERQERVATIAFVAGGTAAVAGLVLVLINQPSARRAAVDRSAARIQLVPMLTPRAAGASVRFPF